MKASDTWGYYQAKKNRGYMYEALADLLGELSVEPQPSESGSDKDKKAGKVKRIEKWKTKAKEYEADGEKIKEQAEGLEKGAERATTCMPALTSANSASNSRWSSVRWPC